MVKFKRINKYISDSGFCSRREADRLVEAGRVLVNGEKAEMGSKIGIEDEVKVDGKLIETEKERVYLAFNKPTGVTCTTDLRDEDNIIDYIGYNERIFPIGRLDKMSEGLIFLTNDGDIVNKILRAGNLHEKEYIVKVDKDVNEDFVRMMGNGIKIMVAARGIPSEVGTSKKSHIHRAKKTLPCKVERKSNHSFRIVLTQGLNRQIRRMCETLGYKVKKLKRIRIMNVELEGIKCGEWRYLSKEEVGEIMEAVESSVGTEDASEIEDEE